MCVLIETYPKHDQCMSEIYLNKERKKIEQCLCDICFDDVEHYDSTRELKA